MKKLRIIIPVLAGLALLSAGCNKDKEKDSSEYVQTSNCAVTSFGIQANSKVLSHLDSVFFSIDLDKGLIFNADSLPAGTDVSALIPVISYPNTVKGAIITMTGGSKRTGQVNYLKSPSDSIDFTGNVTLTLTAQDGVSVKEYNLKVNVHKVQPDSLQWGNIAYSALPSRMGNPKDQKTVTLGNKVYSLIRENNNDLTLSTTSSLLRNDWVKTPLPSPVDFRVRTFTATDKALYILSENGSLYTSPDGTTWTDTGADWEASLGGYGDYLLGIRKAGNELCFTRYPADGFTETAVPADFPVDGFSNMGVFKTKWSTLPTALISGGKASDGNMVRGTWGYDGSSWANISVTVPFALENATMIPYFIYRKVSNIWVMTEYSVWLLTGGMNSDGSLNRNVYVSYDNGVNWQLGSVWLQLPDFIPSAQSTDAVIFDTPMSADVLPKAWKSTPGMKYIPYEIDNGTVTWNCPYIYLFGGVLKNGQLQDAVWRGVLNRMTFRPLF